MFPVGEFSKLAQVSKRQLRFYDQIGLFTPQVVQDNGRRLYSATQLSELNRILVLQELGFSLEHIRKLVQDKLSVAELQGMLKLKQAESEQRLEAEKQRYRAITSRLKHIERSSTQPLDVVLKEVQAQKVLSLKASGTLQEGSLLFQHLLQQFVEEKSVSYGAFFIHLFDNEYDPEQLEGEVGRIIQSGQPLVKQSMDLRLSELLPEPLMATYVLTGSRHDVHLGYSAIGQWAEHHHYRLKGGSREIILQVPRQEDASDTVVEVQLPVLKA
jgi:DNA-binding transcriptional MerR regulator